MYGAMIAALLTALLAHETGHAWAARWVGDETARIAGRTSFNPLRHFDPFGSLVLPLFLWLAGSPFLVGYARPVPINPANFRSRRLGLFLVAAAGPATNLLLALATYPFIDRAAPVGDAFLPTFALLFFIYNLILAAFNLIPLPPLDGSNLMKAILPRPLDTVYILLEPLLLVGLVGLFFTGRVSATLTPLIEYVLLRFSQ